MNVTFDYAPLPVHAPFHQCEAFERLIIGGYGSGKSYALAAEVIALMLEQPGSETMICRKTVPSLRDTSEAIFVNLLPDAFFKQCEVRRMGGHYDRITFPNGSSVIFRGLDNWVKLKSLSLSFIAYDEADEIEQEAYEGLLSRIRQTNPLPRAKAQGAPPITRRGTICAANPAGRNWLYYRFVDDVKRARNSEWFKSTSLDNPFLPADYIRSLLDMPRPWIERYVMASFDEFAGQIYPDWSWDTHVIHPYIEFPKDGLFVQGFDPGTSAGNAAVWCYYDKTTHTLVAIAEYDEVGLAASKHADEWRRIEASKRMKVRRRIADPKAITVRDRGSNMGLDDQYRRLGFNFELGPNAIETRVTALGQLIFNGRFKCTSECPRLAEQIMNYRWADLTPTMREKGTEARPLKKDVDLVDAAQYIAARYIAPPKLQVSKADNGPDAEVRAAIRQQILARRNATVEHDLGTMSL